MSKGHTSKRPATRRPVLTVIIPVYNEAGTIAEIVRRVRKASVKGIAPSKQIIVVDDGSTDGTSEVVRSFPRRQGVTPLHHEKNRGKGAAIRTALEHVRGDILLIQDADLEYDPAEYEKLVRPILQGHADAVYGSRFIESGPHRVLYFWHSVGNKLLTTLSNMFTDLNLTDMETGFKAFRAEAVRSLKLEEDRFGFEPEVTAKVARRARKEGLRIYEVGITYYGRTYAEGKKIGWKDGVKALYCILRYNVFSR